MRPGSTSSSCQTSVMSPPATARRSLCAVCLGGRALCSLWGRTLTGKGWERYKMVALPWCPPLYCVWNTNAVYKQNVCCVERQLGLSKISGFTLWCCMMWAAPKTGLETGGSKSASWPYFCLVWNGMGVLREGGLSLHSLLLASLRDFGIHH